MVIIDQIDKIKGFDGDREDLKLGAIYQWARELYNETIATPGLRWRLGSLNRMLGSLRKGDFGFIFARPETGKTTFLASEVTNFATQLEQPILWFKLQTP